MKLLLSAGESAGVQAIRAARKSGHEIVGVLTSRGNAPDNRLGATVEGVATHFGYPVWDARRVKDPHFAEVIRAESIDILLNVHSLYIAHEAVLSAPRIGSFNLHPGPLPRYAGMNAPGWAILNGEATHGVTLHWMKRGIDTGPIAYQTIFDLEPAETGLDVSRRCSRLGLELIERLLSESPGKIPRIAQDLSRRKYHGFAHPFPGGIPWHSAELIERLVRASNFYPLPSPWGIPTIPWRGGELGLLEVALTKEKCEVPTGTVEIRGVNRYLATEDYWLELRRVLLESKVINWE